MMERIETFFEDKLKFILRAEPGVIVTTGTERAFLLAAEAYKHYPDKITRIVIQDIEAFIRFGINLLKINALNKK